MRRFICVAAAAALAASAQAELLVIPLAGWQASGGFLAPGNTDTTINLPVGSTIDAAEYSGLTYTANAPSWGSELVLSLNDSTAFLDFWDTDIAGTPDNPGSFGPLSGPFANPGLFGSGPFTVSTGSLYVEVYDNFDDAGVDAVISAGELRITYTIPEPSALLLLATAGLFIRRR